MSARENGCPVPKINKLFPVEYGIQYVLDWTSHPELALRADVVCWAKQFPDRVAWLGTQKIRVIFPDRVRATMRVPAFQIQPAENGGQPEIAQTRATVRRPMLRRRGRVVSSTDMRKFNGLDRAVDEMMAGFLDFEAAWIERPSKRLTVGVSQDAVSETSGRAILYLPNA